MQGRLSEALQDTYVSDVICADAHTRGIRLTINFPIRQLIYAALLVLTCSSSLFAQEATTAKARRGSWARHERMAKESPFSNLRWRAAGPKFQGGRIEAIAFPPKQLKTIYLGVGSGGVFKTTDAGRTWKGIFDDQSTTAIGSIAVDPSKSETIWVGTGETHPGMSFPGTGIFKSTDGGATWRNMGLHDSHHIARVIVDPKNSDTVYAGVMGHHHSRNNERGVFKTTDGGKTWRRVLFVNDSTGIVDLVIDPHDRLTLYAAAWSRHGPGSGIHKTTDGGKTWKKLAGGLPSTREIGRIGIDLSHAKKGLVYALVVNRRLARGRRPGGAEVYRSEDGGKSFRRTHKRPLSTWIGWDFCDIRIAPDDPKRIYVCGMQLLVSSDGGATFQHAREKIRRLHKHAATVLHLDMHEIVLDPASPGRVLLGTDGGLFVSADKAKSWLHINNLPIGEFYTVHLDMHKPYRIWGGTQDNASLYGPSTYVVDSSSPDPWKHVFLDRWGGGDGFVTLPDPTDPNVAYYEHQRGGMRRKRLDGPLLSGHGDKSIRPRGERGKPPLRFAWNTPLIISHHNPRTLYCAAQRVLKSGNRGDSWTAISPDLDRSSILSLSESPSTPGLLYAGGYGRAHVTRNGGKSWADASRGLPRMEITRVAASRHDQKVVYASLNAARRDHFDPYVYRSQDYGKTWRSISANLPAEPVYVVAEDPHHANVLYVGTQLGVYVSLDTGATWISLCTKLPPVPVFDLAVHPRDHELVIATHGRSMFVLDVSKIQSAAKGRKQR
jgi:photosystem II stability/assembly factor-like uncharacterized protein